MALNQPLHFISEQDYLAGELMSMVKYEYIHGDVYAMAGASKNHDKIAGNIFAKFHLHLEKTACMPFSSDVKVKVENDYFYPDVTVVCDENSGDSYYTESPIIIVEVLSKSTRRMDQTLKRQAYQTLPSLEEYVLIEQDSVDVEICRRANHWQSEHYYLGDVVYFAAIDLHLPVGAIYARVVNPDMQEFLAPSHGKSNDNE
ncbi:MAG: Uma2 family endonuclease [Candidatus Competibacteraceae bacterium]